MTNYFRFSACLLKHIPQYIVAEIALGEFARMLELLHNFKGSLCGFMYKFTCRVHAHKPSRYVSAMSEVHNTNTHCYTNRNALLWRLICTYTYNETQNNNKRTPSQMEVAPEHTRKLTVILIALVICLFTSGNSWNTEYYTLIKYL